MISRASRILELALPGQHGYTGTYDPKLLSGSAGYDDPYSPSLPVPYNQGGIYQQQQQQMRPPTRQELKEIELELRRENPDLLDTLKFAMSDRQWGTLLKYLMRGAFWGAAVYAQPFIVGPLIGARTYSRHKQIKKQRRFAGITPRFRGRASPGTSALWNE